MPFAHVRPLRTALLAAAITTLGLLLALVGFPAVPALAAAGSTSFRPGQEWLDDNDEPVQGHGGQVVTSKDADGATVYYWYGEDRTNGYERSPGVHVYSSTDLYNWVDGGVALRTMSSPDDFEQPYFEQLYGSYDAEQRAAVYRDLGVTSPADGVPGAILERPKVIYNEHTKTWVMWVHADGPSATSDAQYAKAQAGVAVSSSPFGPFRYIDSYRLDRVPADDPTNAHPQDPGMARDMNLFVDDDQTAYIVYASEENLTLYISKLDADYTGLATDPAEAVEGEDFRRPQPYIGGQREAPAITKVGDTYYLMTSGATGWAPNAASYATSTSLLGTWTPRGNPISGSGSSTACDSQSTSLLNLGDGRVIYVGDRWANAEDLYRAKSIWLPVSFGEAGAMTIECRDTPWTLSNLDSYTPWTVTTEIPSLFYVKQWKALPGRISVKEAGKTRRVSVAWDTDTLTAPGNHDLRGTLGDGRVFTRPVTVVPKKLRYLVNAGGLATPDYTAARRRVVDDGARLLNSVPEQALGSDPATGARWGYLGTTGGTNGTDAGTMSTTLRWQADGTDLAYRFNRLPAGQYRVDLGFYDPWSSSAPGRAASVSLNGKVIADNQVIDATSRSTGAKIRVRGDKTLDVVVHPTTRFGIQVSWIMISKA